jgi:hypothetical protein
MAWDPILVKVKVIVGSLTTLGIGNWFIDKKPKPLFDEYFHKPTLIDKPLLIGATIFGWVLVGFCPGPVIVAKSIGSEKSLDFCYGHGCGSCLDLVLSAQNQAVARLAT